MRTPRLTFTVILLTIWISLYSQNDFTKDFNGRLIKSILPPLPSQIKFTKNFCEILGMLNEYMGRHIDSFAMPNEDLVDFFYSVKRDNESAEYFRILIENYEKEIGTSFNLRIQAQNGFYSKSLCSLINCLYLADFNPLYLFTLNKKYLLDLSDDLKYAYLKGVYYRFGNGNEISIANGIQKLKTVALVMESLGIENIKLYSSGPNTLPTDYVLTFESSSFLKEQIDYRDSESKLKFYTDKRIVNYKIDY
jgi:hypothetical protein